MTGTHNRPDWIDKMRWKELPCGFFFLILSQFISSIISLNTMAIASAYNYYVDHSIYRESKKTLDDTNKKETTFNRKGIPNSVKS